MLLKYTEREEVYQEDFRMLDMCPDTFNYTTDCENHQRFD